jgi:hypothetical protein
MIKLEYSPLKSALGLSDPVAVAFGFLMLFLSTCSLELSDGAGELSRILFLSLPHSSAQFDSWFVWPLGPGLNGDCWSCLSSQSYYYLARPRDCRRRGLKASM